jgi:hypothetical protein
LENLAEGQFPLRGEYCEHCERFIPAFADVASETERRIRALPKLQQMIELRTKTGCSLGWAKIWTLHPDGPRPKFGWVGPPCPNCGKPLRTYKAKQCVVCGADWH